MRVLSICTGMGLLDLAFKDAGFDVVPGCEIHPDMRRMHDLLVGGEYLAHELQDLIETVRGQRFNGIIGGPPCQSFSRTRAMRDPKYPDLTPQVRELTQAVEFDWFLFENVAPVKIPGARAVKLNAMHYDRPHQSRERWFTFTPNLTPPGPRFVGTVDELMAYPAVAGKIYGPKRGAKLQGYPPAAELPVSCAALQLGLANAVPYGLGSAWARQALRISTTPSP